jgi:hypothetical protein
LSFARGEIVVCLVLWLIAAIGASCFVISAWYEGLRFVIDPQGITKVNLRGAQFYPFEQMTEARPSVWTPPGWFKKLAWLLVLADWRHAGPVLLGAYSLNWGLEVPCRDGRTLKVWADKLVGLDKIQEALRRAGISIPEPETEGAEE